MNPAEESSPTNSDIVTHLAVRARAGDKTAFGELLERFRPRLERLIELRLDRRLRQRLDPADVMQDLFVRGGGHFESEAEWGLSSKWNTSNFAAVLHSRF